jgi:hypothetical protein
MTSQIDPNYPPPGNPQTEDVRDNFDIMAEEITALQDDVAAIDLNMPYLPLAGATKGASMIGPLLLAREPVDTREAGTKGYADQLLDLIADLDARLDVLEAAPPHTDDAAASVALSQAWLRSMTLTRSIYSSSTLAPDSLAQDRWATGAWTGTWTAPVDPSGLPYTPVLVTGPLWFPLAAGKRVDFAGRVDNPFCSMNGWAGQRAVAAGTGTCWGSSHFFGCRTTDGAYPTLNRTLTFSVWLRLTDAQPVTPAWQLELVDGSGGFNSVKPINVTHTWQLCTLQYRFPSGSMPGPRVYIRSQAPQLTNAGIEVASAVLVDEADPTVNLLPPDHSLWFIPGLGDTSGINWTADNAPGPMPPEAANGGTSWGLYFVIGTNAGAVRFRAPCGPDAVWKATVDSVVAGEWGFQLVTYATDADAANDFNRILIGNPWLESQRPGDVRGYYAAGYTPGTPQFTGVVLSPTSGGSKNTISGSLSAFTPVAGCTYQILVTNEADTEYAWALEPVSAGPFLIERESFQTFGGKIKLRLVEQVNGCSVRVVGQVWAEENALDPGAFQDLRVEYRAITIGPAPFTAVQPAQYDHSWSVPLAGAGAIGRVTLVNVNTKRILGQYTMPSGLARSFIVPPDQAGQDNTSVYYDGFLDTCFLYDQAVALIGYLQMGQQAEAVKMIDALLDVQNANGSFSFAVSQSELYVHNADYIRIGAIAWVCYAMLLCASPPFVAWFPKWPGGRALDCLNFILGYLNSIGTVNGGSGTTLPDGTVDPSFEIPWWSMEHNIDVWWCLDLADQLYGSAGAYNYRAIADAQKASLLQPGRGWDSGKSIFWQGGVADAGGNNTPDGMHALDTHTWGGVLMTRWNAADPNIMVSLDRAEEFYYVTDVPSGLSGYTTFVPEDGYPPETVQSPWYEGSFGAVVAWRGVDADEADELMAELIRAQRPDGSYLYALQNDPVNDIHAWPCIIASAWNILAFSGPGTPNSRVLWPLTSPIADAPSNTEPAGR